MADAKPDGHLTGTTISISAVLATVIFFVVSNAGGDFVSGGLERLGFNPHKIGRQLIDEVMRRPPPEDLRKKARSKEKAECEKSLVVEITTEENDLRQAEAALASCSGSLTSLATGCQGEQLVINAIKARLEVFKQPPGC